MEGPRTPLTDVTNLIRRMTMQEAPAGQQTPAAAQPNTSQEDHYNVMKTLEWINKLIEQHRRDFEQLNN